MILLGDCIERMRELESNSVDAVVTDPPYGWSFMGKAWDNFDIEKRRQQQFNRPPRKDGKSRGQGDPALCAGIYDQSTKGNRNFQAFTELYCKEVYRVLKPGGHMLVFCGPRTYHRMACGVEDAGFEIRDQLQWLFGSGFPKSHDISKAIDKAAGAEREVVGERCSPDGVLYSARQPKEWRQAGFGENYITAPATPEAKQWQGWGTALKPANEPIVLARKPLEKGLTVAQNVAKWGVGGLNIDESRIGTDDKIESVSNQNIRGHLIGSGGSSKERDTVYVQNVKGRWPANVLLDEVAAEMLDEPSGIREGGHNPKRKVDAKSNFTGDHYYGDDFRDKPGGASRFFYVAKASKRERNAGLEGEIKEKQGARPNSADSTGKFPDHDHRPTGGNNHPTVKPIKLMEYLIKLITPPGGIVLDPFMGSGSTGVAAKRLGFEFIGIEMNEEYVEIANKRIETA